MQFFDMHSHILPELDDGAQSVDESLMMLNCLKRQNVKNICLTPHFYTHEMSVEDFIEQRRAAYESFWPSIPSSMNTVLGAEVYVTKYLFSNEDLSGITYGKSRYILTEFNYTSSFSEKTMNQIVMLIENHGLIPVIPHVERYEMLMSDFAVLQELKDMGVVIQTNVSNYAQKSPFFKRRKLLKLIGDGMIDILGTDAHSMTRSSPEAYSQAIECIADKCGNTAVRRLMKNAEKIFTAAANSAEAEMK